MNMIIDQIVARMEAAKGKPLFLDVLFGGRKQEALAGAPVVLFGAGGLGTELCLTLRLHGVNPVCFCDNDNSKGGGTYCGLPVITFEELRKSFAGSLVVIASHKYLGPLTDQLLANGFSPDRVFCQKSAPLTPILFMYSMVGTQHLYDVYRDECAGETVLDILRSNEQAVSDAYHMYADQHSKDLFISKLALMASDRDFALFKDFIEGFSQPVLKFGTGNYEGTPEDYFYFNNDVITLSPGEVYLDVGAYDGDTVHTFVEACRKFGVDYAKIEAFEPDPNCFRALQSNTAVYDRVNCHQEGVWSQSQVLRFSSSEVGIHDQSGIIADTGNIEVKVVALDDFLPEGRVTLIKMDPGGNVIPEGIRGAAKMIARCRPKLALGAYHSVRSMFEIPLLLRQICPDYSFYLRHNTYHLCDTDLFAVVSQ